MFTFIILPTVLVIVAVSLILRLIVRPILNPYRIRHPYFGPYGYYGYGAATGDTASAGFCPSWCSSLSTASSAVAGSVAPAQHLIERRSTMALLERVGTLLRANINDLIEKAEDPEKLAKQLVLDMENQLLQVKTQVAIAIADQHLLQKKLKEHEEAMNQLNRKAELAVQKQQDDLARAALERSISHQQLAQSFAQQLEDQTTEAETLRNAFTKLQQKLEETRSACEMLMARNRRARTIGKANAARTLAATHQTAVDPQPPALQHPCNAKPPTPPTPCSKPKPSKTA